MTKQILHAMSQRRGGGRAARASAPHVQIDRAVAKAFKRNIAAILSHCRPHPAFEQFFAGVDDVDVGGFEKLPLAFRQRLIEFIAEHRLAG